MWFVSQTLDVPAVFDCPERAAKLVNEHDECALQETKEIRRGRLSND